MAHFVCFFRGGTGQEDWVGWISSLKSQNCFVIGAPLTKDGKIVSKYGEGMADFIFDIKENARGFVIIEANDFEKAAGIIKTCPVFDNGGNITIRPIDVYF